MRGSDACAGECEDLVEGFGRQWPKRPSSAATRSRQPPATSVRSTRWSTRPEQMSRYWSGVELGDPSVTRSAILAVVDAKEPPLRIFFGKSQLAGVTSDYQSRLATWNQWQPVSIEAFRHND